LPASEEEKIEYVQPYEKKLEVDISFEIQPGYDNNVDLNSKRRKDGFLQSTANAEIDYPLTETMKVEGGVDLFTTIYYIYNVDNIFDVAPYIELDWWITEDYRWQNKIMYDYFSYPNDKASTYSSVQLSTDMRQYLSDSVYHEIEYRYSERWYPDRKATRNDGIRDNADRKDNRNTIKYTIGASSATLYLKLSNELYHNNSNDNFMDYYDYLVYRVRPSITYFFTDNIFANTNFSYKLILYDDRRVRENTERTVRDNTFTWGTSLFYDLTKNIMLGVTYVYTENVSNEPFNKYSGSIASGGVYYTF
ncbi:MAG: hypothetical protein ACE5JK_07230, partial [Candidatus Omnitrophota bacterium]